MSEIDEDRRKGQREQYPEIAKIGTRLADRLEDGADNPDVKCQCRGLPDDERGRIGQQRERGGDKEKKRRIEPRVIWRPGAEDLLLAGIMRGHVVGIGRGSLPGT